ncbi:hypothetical protein [Neobacillus muris]|uniref:hypothetical protein n=1 Tax=Neobacillus muris TaxID=2941334 RepID=UPI00203A8AC0|nr:hypothetical protein [Neobacillus muris]
MVKKGCRLFTIISLSIGLWLMSSCSPSEGKEESKRKETSREVLGFYTEQEGTFPGSQPTVDSYYTSLSSIATRLGLKIAIV